MEEINQRFILLRKELGLSQRGLGDSIGLSNSGVSNIENGIRNVTDQHIKLLQSEFNANEEWLRNGEGEMFMQSTVFSLDEYAQKNQLSELELDIIKGYMNLNKDVRQTILSTAQQIFGKHSETAATTVTFVDNSIEAELEDYRLELEAEQKGATLSASHGQDAKESG